MPELNKQTKLDQIDQKAEQNDTIARVEFRYFPHIHSASTFQGSEFDKIEKQYKIIFAALSFILKIDVIQAAAHYYQENEQVQTTYVQNKEHEFFITFLRKHAGSVRVLDLTRLGASGWQLHDILRAISSNAKLKSTLQILNIAYNSFNSECLELINEKFPNLVVKGLDQWCPHADNYYFDSKLGEPKDNQLLKEQLKQRNNKLSATAEKEEKEQPAKTNQAILDLLPSKIQLHNPGKNDIEINIDDKFSVSSYSRSFFSSLFGGLKMSFREYIKDLYNKAPDKALRIVQALRQGNILELSAALQERRIMTCFSGATVGTQLLDAMFRDFNNAALRHGLGLSH